MIELKVQEGAVLLPVKIVPGASRTEVLGEWNGRLRIAVAAAPQRGKANAELCAFLAKRLGLRKSDVEVVLGATTPQKVVRIGGVAPNDLLARLLPSRS